jgi:hypothetical protein
MSVRMSHCHFMLRVYLQLGEFDNISIAYEPTWVRDTRRTHSQGKRRVDLPAQGCLALWWTTSQPHRKLVID